MRTYVTSSLAAWRSPHTVTAVRPSTLTLSSNCIRTTRRAMAALESLGYKPLVPVSAHEFADPQARQAWIRDKRMIVFQLHSEQHRDTRIDLFVTEPFDFDHEYEHALIGSLAPGLPLRFVRLDTLIRMKEAAGREKDMEDARQLKKLAEDQDHGE